MRRRARIFPLVRGRLPASVGVLNTSSRGKWPRHLQLAWNILDDEFPERAARALVIESVLAAHKCAQKIGGRAKILHEYDTRIKVGNAFVRLANCTRRAPAELRQSVDQYIAPLINATAVDLEVIEEIIGSATTAFGQFPEHEAARTALGALRVSSHDGEQIIGLKTDYPTLNFDAQRSCESALSALAMTPTGVITASEIFEALGSAIATDRPAGNGSNVSDLIVRYVAAVAVLWRKYELSPSRATRRFDSKYRSRFHRFAELVLTAMTEPGGRRHDEDIDLIAHNLRVAHARLPIELRAMVSPALKRANVEWLVAVAVANQ
jgi:hypothetical protein